VVVVVVVVVVLVLVVAAVVEFAFGVYFHTQTICKLCIHVNNTEIPSRMSC
jgi:hypothetical protein